MPPRAARQRSRSFARCSDRSPWTPSAHSSWFPFSCCLPLDRLLECNESLTPESVEPPSQCFDAARIDRVQPLSVFDADHGKSRRLEHFEVLQDCRAAHVHALGNLRHRAVAFAQALEYQAAGCVSQCVECSLCVEHCGDLTTVAHESVSLYLRTLKATG